MLVGSLSTGVFVHAFAAEPPLPKAPLAESHGRLVETCVACHSVYLNPR
ncbi:MAG: hypothetical protein ABW123_19800 [Cystobacter sp.]